MLQHATTMGRRIAFLVRVVAIAGIAALVFPLIPTPASARDHDSAEEWAPPTRVYVPETGHTVDGLFLDLWRNGGGVWAFGNPITPEITLPNGHIIQYYGYARFEYWPEGDADGNLVRLGDIGQELRPVTVPRTMLGFKGANAKESRAAIEAMAMAKAWLPLDAKHLREDSDEWRFVPETGHSVATGFKAFWERTGEAGYLGNPVTEEYTIAGVTYQVFERGQLAWEPGTDPSMMPVGKMLAERYGLDQSAVEQGTVPAYSEDLFIPPPPPAKEENAGTAPPPPPGAKQSIVVSLSQQRMWAYKGEDVVLSSLVSTGKERFETPPGTYQILVKKEIEDMEGLIGGEYYNVPQVPDVMYFTDVGHAFHGAYWHNDFGTPRSHGCINLPLDVAAWLYDWTPLGTTVLIVP
ncbi:MAG: L,D-transpeptidase [Chloroflexota bacterium]|nr:L,D-transpeptidase [Chloroflexota bacterium]